VKQPNPPTPFPGKEGGFSGSPSPLGGGGWGVGSSSPDAVVIGAGPAGAVAARELARHGCSVLLVDKSHFPRPKVCGCCVNVAAVNTLRKLGLGHVLANGIPLRDVRIAAGRRSARVRLPGGVSLSRETFDAALVTEAIKAGVQFRDGVSAKFDNGEVCLSERPGLSRPPCVTVVASGLAGSDATPEAGSRIGAGVSVPADAVPAFFASGTIFMATGRGGYVGLVRVEDGRLDVAAAFDVDFQKSHGGLGPAAEAVLTEVGWRVPGLAQLPWKGTPTLTRRAKLLAGERWFAVGDAAGYVEPFTGEGMAWAVMSGTALAPIAARGVQRWDASLVSEWEATHRRAIGSRQRVCRVVSRVLRSPSLTKFAVRALSVFPVLSRPVIASLNRPAILHGALA
jgi:2-polyprenyl-6-methoxyphenol hydroxylase-like FAD-dependent oxidoreductase